MTSTYENVPVFRSGSTFGADGPEHLVGRAKVEMNAETEKLTITIDAGENLTKFINIGELMALEISAFVQNVDRKLADEFWSQQQ